MPKLTAEELVFFTDIASGWERAHAAFLDGKQRRSGSRRTVESYSRMLQGFFARLGKSPKEAPSQDVLPFGHRWDHQATSRPRSLATPASPA